MPDHVASLQSAFGGYLEDHRLPSEKKKKPRAGGPKKVRASLGSRRRLLSPGDLLIAARKCEHGALPLWGRGKRRMGARVGNEEGVGR